MVGDVLANTLQDVFSHYKALDRHRGDFAVVQGRPMIAGDDRQLESYPPDESWNPVPGKATTEVYNTGAQPGVLRNLVAGDMLHHLRAVDPQWAAMAADVMPQGMDPNRGDEFLMGYLTPDAADEWKNVYTPEQRAKLGRMGDYLIRGSNAPGFR